MRHSGKISIFWLLLCTAPLQAQESMEALERHPYMTSKVWIDLGAYYPDRTLKASIDGSISGEHESIDFERAFGLNDQDGIGSGEIGWQFGEKWGLSAQYFASERTSSRVIDKKIEWGDIVYDVGASVKGGSELDITRFVMYRRFRQRGPHDLRLAAGIHWLEMGAFIEGQAQIDDMETEFKRGAIAAKVPLPNVGAWYRYSPNENWVFSLRGDWLEASVGEYRGRILNALIGVNFSPNKNFGIGINYQYLQLAASIKNDTWRGDVKMSYAGPYANLSAYF